MCKIDQIDNSLLYYKRNSYFWYLNWLKITNANKLISLKLKINLMENFSNPITNKNI